MTTLEFLEELAWTAVTKPANSDIYTEQMASFVETFARLGVPGIPNAAEAVMVERDIMLAEFSSVAPVPGGDRRRE